MHTLCLPSSSWIGSQTNQNEEHLPEQQSTRTQRKWIVKNLFVELVSFFLIWWWVAKVHSVYSTLKQYLKYLITINVYPFFWKWDVSCRYGITYSPVFFSGSLLPWFAYNKFKMIEILCRDFSLWKTTNNQNLVAKQYYLVIKWLQGWQFDSRNIRHMPNGK